MRQLTKRRVPLTTGELIEELNPVWRGWGQHYKRAHVRKLFNRLNRWIVHRFWSHRFRRWRNCGWQQLPESMLYVEYGLVNRVRLQGFQFAPDSDEDWAPQRQVGSDSEKNKAPSERVG